MTPSNGSIPKSLLRQESGDDSTPQPTLSGFCGETAKGSKLALSRERVAALMDRFRSTRQLSDDPTGGTKWLVESLVPFGALILLTGAPKGGGKTTFLTHMLAGVIDGKKFLGHSTTASGFVYLTEQGRGFEDEYLSPVGLMRRNNAFVMNAFETGGFSWTEVVEAATQFCRDNGVRALIVDTISQFARIQGDGENSSGVVLEALRPLQAAAQRDLLSVIVVHHSRKSGGDIIESGRGSTAYAQVADVILNIRHPRGHNRASNLRELQVVGRYKDLMRLQTVELTDVGYVISDDQQVSLRKATTAVLNALPKNPSDAVKSRELWMTLRGSGFRQRTLEEALKELASTGQIERRKLRGKGSPFGYWMQNAATLSPQKSTSSGREVSP